MADLYVYRVALIASTIYAAKFLTYMRSSCLHQKQNNNLIPRWPPDIAFAALVSGGDFSNQIFFSHRPPVASRQEASQLWYFGVISVWRRDEEDFLRTADSKT